MLPAFFEAEATVSFDDTDYAVSMNRYADSNWVIEFFEPLTVKGLIFTLNGEDTEISFNGLHFTFDTEKFPVGSVVSILTDSLDRLIPNELDIVAGDTTNFASGQFDDMSYSLTLDKFGNPITLEFGNSGMKIEFTEFMPIEAEE